MPLSASLTGSPGQFPACLPSADRPLCTKRPCMGVPAVWADHAITVSGAPPLPCEIDSPFDTCDGRRALPSISNALIRSCRRAASAKPIQLCIGRPTSTSALNVRTIPKPIEVGAGLPAVFLAVACPPPPACHWPSGFAIQYQCTYPSKAATQDRMNVIAWASTVFVATMRVTGCCVPFNINSLYPFLQTCMSEAFARTCIPFNKIVQALPWSVCKAVPCF